MYPNCTGEEGKRKKKTLGIFLQSWTLLKKNVANADNKTLGLIQNLEPINSPWIPIQDVFVS